jgi:hypothetical protein
MLFPPHGHLAALQLQNASNLISENSGQKLSQPQNSQRFLAAIRKRIGMANEVTSGSSLFTGH